MENNKWVETPESSLISGFRYNHVDQTLHVGFKTNDSMYAYFDVPAHEIDIILSHPEGKSKTIKRNIIDTKKYKYKKL